MARPTKTQAKLAKMIPPATPETARLTTKAMWHIMKPLVKAGHTYDMLATALSAQGYMTLTGRRFIGAHISKAALKLGGPNYRRLRRTMRSSNKLTKTTVSEPEQLSFFSTSSGIETDLDFVRAVLSLNSSPELKHRILTRLLNHA